MVKNTVASAPRLSKQEKKWRAESDAHTLAEAKVIMSDPKRLTSAAKEAGRMAKEKEDQAKAMKSVARKGGK